MYSLINIIMTSLLVNSLFLKSKNGPRPERKFTVFLVCSVDGDELLGMLLHAFCTEHLAANGIVDGVRTTIRCCLAGAKSQE